MPKLISINKDELEKILTERTPEIIKVLKTVGLTQLPRLMFTAIDNDLLSKIDLIKLYVLKRGKIPIVGESALGTYQATNHHKGNKQYILRDCLSLIDLCDEFNIFVDTKETNLLKIISQIPDGVVYEVAYWFRTGKKHVNIININTTSPTIFPIDSSMLDILSKQFIGEINEKLDAHVNHILPAHYAVLTENNTKYTDWIRQDIYKDNQVPVIPTALVSAGLIVMTSGDNLLTRLVNRAAIATRCGHVCIYGAYKRDTLKLAYLPLDLLLELFLIINLYPVKKFEYKSFAEVGIPKYNEPEVWAVTAKELAETREEQKNASRTQASSLLTNSFTYFPKALQDSATKNLCKSPALTSKL